MKLSFFKAIVIIFCLFCEVSAVWANETLQYELTQEKVETAWLTETRKGYYTVVVKLKKPHREFLSELTGNNVGKRLTVIFSGQVLTSAVVKDRIDSGIILAGEWGSEQDAREFMETLLPKLREDTGSGS